MLKLSRIGPADRFLDVFFLLLAVILSEGLYQEGKIKSQKKEFVQRT